MKTKLSREIEKTYLINRFQYNQMSKVKLVKHIPLDEMKLLIRKEKNKHVHERLLFICQLYFGDSFREARTRMCISEQTAYDWLKRWNEKGYDGLVPGFGGGRPPELNKDNKEQLKKMIREKNNWLTSEIRALIRKEFNVSHTERHVSRILRSLGMNYAKPYPTDYRQPRDAEERLKQSIEDVLDSVPDNCVVGFFDEASPQTTDNKQRFWSFGKPGITMNTTKYRANTFGFYPMNGKEVVEFMDHSKSQNVCDFLRKISDKTRVSTLLYSLTTPGHILQNKRVNLQDRLISPLFSYHHILQSIIQ